ncbi:MAG TPA: signal peptidase II [Myxococcota bacterium]
MSAWIWKNKVIWLVAWVVGMVALDQGSKMWAQGALAEPRVEVKASEQASPDGATTEKVDERTEDFVPKRTIVVVPGLWNFKYAENRAAAFSLTQSIPEGARRPLLLLVSLCACALIAAWYMKLKSPDALLMTSFALIIAGALGNFLDRARLAYVIDFIDFYVASDGLGAWLREPHNIVGISFRLSDHWPTFNVADSCIVSGAIGVILRTLRPLPVGPAKPAS